MTIVIPAMTTTTSCNELSVEGTFPSRSIMKKKSSVNKSIYHHDVDSSSSTTCCNTSKNFRQQSATEKKNKRHDLLHCISFYLQRTSKLLIQPFSESKGDVLFSKMLSHSIWNSATIKENYVPNSCLFRFDRRNLWCDTQQAGVRARHLVIDIVRAMKQYHDKQLLVSATLTASQNSAETLFFSTSTNINQDQQHSSSATKKTEQHPHTVVQKDDISCILFSNHDKIRFISIPEQEINDLERDARQSWKQGIAKIGMKYDTHVFQFHGRPWDHNNTAEASIHQNNDDRRVLVMRMLRTMLHHGWQKVIPVGCTISGGGGFQGDSLLFFRSRHQQANNVDEKDNTCDQTFIRTCCISLEGTDTIRLIGTNDKSTMDAVEQIIATTWPKGIQQSRIRTKLKDITLIGSPWNLYSMAESIDAARTVCRIIESLRYLGWEWHCAVNISRSVQEKSTFVFKRVLGASTSGCKNNNAIPQKDSILIGCLQIKSYNKINLVRFPPKIIRILIEKIREFSPWKIKKVQTRGTTTAATITFDGMPHDAHTTQEKANQGKFYLDVLKYILNTNNNEYATKLLGCADISSCATGTDEETDASPVDSDVFLFEFQVTLCETMEIRSDERRNITNNND